MTLNKDDLLKILMNLISKRIFLKMLLYDFKFIRIQCEKNVKIKWKRKF